MNNNNFEFFTELALKNASYVAGTVKAHFAPYKELEEFELLFHMADYFSHRASDLYCLFEERQQEVEFMGEVVAFKEAFIKFLEFYKESKFRIHEIEFRERNPEF